MTKRVLAFLMVIAMVLSLVPTIAVAAAEHGYTLTLQKAHNQTDGQLAVDVYLTANAADQGNVTGYGFDVTPAEGLNIFTVTDFTGNDGVAGSDKTFVYNPVIAPEIAVGTTRVPVATIVLSGETIPADFASALTLSNISVSTAAGYYQDTVVEHEDYKGAVTVATAVCEHQHEAGLTWTPATADVLFAEDGLAEGNYYLVGDVTATRLIKPAAENAEINLCLNGYTFTTPSTTKGIDMNKSGAEIHISDCTATGTGEALKAGKFVLKYYRWGNLAITKANTQLSVKNVILEGAEDAVSTDADDSNVGNAAAFYASASAVGGGLTAENVLIKNVNAGKTVVDNRANMHLKDVTFVNCTGGVQGTKDLGIISVNGAPADGSELIIEDCKFINCADEFLHTNSRAAEKFTLKGNVQATGAAFIGGDCNLTLDLDEQASVVIETEKNKTAETFGEAVTITDTLPKNVLTYVNQNGALVNYADGKFSFGEVHAHADGYAGIKSSQVWKPWTNPNALPSVAGYYYLTTDVTTDEQAPNGNINICLNGHTIDSSEADRFCTVYSYTRTFCDCQGYADPDKAGTIIGGTNNQGSVFRVRGRTATMRGSYLYLYDIKLASNGTNTNSSAIFCEASTVDSTKNKGILTMERVEVYGNECYVGGALRLEQTENKDNAITITIDECKFHDNTSRDGGGAMYLRVYDGVDSENTSITITNSKFYNNSSTNHGGAIYAQNLKYLTIEDCEFTENQSIDETDNTRGGGAIAMNNAVVQITDTTFDSNSSESGGAIYANTGCNLTITGSTFTDNTATTSMGGAIRSTTATTVVDISNTTFTGNSAASSAGGAIYTVNAGNTLKLTDCIITGNTDKLGGGGVYMTTKGSVLVLSGKTIIAGNTSIDAPAYSGDLFYQKNNEWTTPLMQVNELAEGAQINAYYANEAANTDLTPDDIVKVADGGTQTAWQDCGRIGYHNGTTHERVSYFNDTFTFGHWHKAADGTYYELAPWTATNSLPDALADNGHGYYLTGDVTVVKTSSGGVGNRGELKATAHNESGYDYELCLNGFDVTTNNAYNSYVLILRSANGWVGDCSAAFDKNGHLISGGSFHDIKNTENGAAIYLTDDNNIGQEITFYGVELSNTTTSTQRNGTSTTAYGGGAIHVRNYRTSPGTDKVTMNVIGCKFTNNTAAADGGAIEGQNGVDMNITDTVFEGNHAGRYGGAINLDQTGSAYRVHTTNVTIDNCKFIDNYATTNATNWSTNLAAAKNTGRGGAIYASYANVTVTDSTFQGNYVTQNEAATGTVDVHGGAIAAVGSTVTLNNCTVTENSATEGGAIYLAGSNTLNINGGIYSKNEANCSSGDKGGGVVRSASSTDTINVDTYTAPTEGAEPQGAIFTENNSVRSGGVFLLGSAKLNMNGATMTGNTARSNAAITMWGAAEVSLNDTTITGNHSSTGGYGTVAVGSGQSSKSVLTLSGMTIIDDNTYGDSNVEENVTLRDNTSARVNVGETGLTEGAHIGLKARTARLDQIGFFLISDDLGDMNDPSEYFFSDDGNYSIKLMNTQVPVTTMATTPTTAEEAAESQQAYTDALAQKESGELLGVTGTTVTISGVQYTNCLQYTVAPAAEDAAFGNHLCFVSASVGEDFYHTVQDAIDANEGTSNVVQLESNVTSALTVSDNVTINLNGNTVSNVTVSNGAKISVIDERANDYDSSDAGKIKVAEGAYEPYVEANNKRYAVISNGDGTVTAHRIYVSINTAVLRTTNGGIGYKMIFAGDETVQAKIAAGEFSYGVKFSVGTNDPVIHEFAGNEFVAYDGKTSTPNQRLAVIENIVEQGNTENAARAEIEITGQPFITVGGETAWGTARTFNLNDLAAQLLAHDAVSAEDKALVTEFLTAYGLN